MTQTLLTFIYKKTIELEEKYSEVELDSYTSVTLRGTSVGEAFNARSTHLKKKGHEVAIGEFPDLPPFSPENGTEVIFNVTAKGKRKPRRISFYFLWDK